MDGFPAEESDFSVLYRIETGFGTNQLIIQWVPGAFPEGKAAGA
jgi:hypothetical protein